MQTIKPIIKDEIKLDSVLSLIVHAQQNGLNLLSLFHDRYGSLLLGDLERLENILFQDGLVRYAVNPEGLEICMTAEGLAFMNHGGYGSDLIEIIYPGSAVNVRSTHFRKYIAL